MSEEDIHQCDGNSYFFWITAAKSLKSDAKDIFFSLMCQTRVLWRGILCNWCIEMCFMHYKYSLLFLTLHLIFPDTSDISHVTVGLLAKSQATLVIPSLSGGINDWISPSQDFIWWDFFCLGFIRQLLMKGRGPWAAISPVTNPSSTLCKQRDARSEKMTFKSYPLHYHDLVDKSRGHSILDIAWKLSSKLGLFIF